MGGADGCCLGELAVHSNRWGVGTHAQLKKTVKINTLRVSKRRYLIRLGVTIRAPPFIEPAISCLEAAGAAWNKQNKKMVSACLISFLLLPRGHELKYLLGRRTREDEMFHWEFSVADGSYTESVTVRVPVERGDGTSVAANLKKGRAAAVSMTYVPACSCKHVSSDDRHTVVRVKGGDNKAVSNSKKTGFSSSPMMMHPSRGSSLPVKKISKLKRDIARGGKQAGGAVV